MIKLGLRYSQSVLKPTVAGAQKYVLELKQGIAGCGSVFWI